MDYLPLIFKIDMTNKTTYKTTAFRLVSVTILATGLISNAHATAAIMAQYHAPSCQTCHTQGAYSKSEGKAGLTKFLAAEAAFNLKHRPVISPIGHEMDAEVDQAITPIQLTVTDPDDDQVKIVPILPKALLPDAKVSPEYTDNNGLPAFDFNWTPSVKDVNKVYVVKFVAKETDTVKKLFSAPVTKTIRVWPAGNRDQAYVKNVVISTTKWAANTLTLKGKVVLTSLPSAKEKIDFLSRTDLTVNITQGKNGTGTVISNLQPITFLNPKTGSWNISLPLSGAGTLPCNITLEFEGKRAAHKIAGVPTSCVD